jgi:hypothetical protein
VGLPIGEQKQCRPGRRQHASSNEQDGGRHRIALGGVPVT